jgi:hypothetical protein
MKWVLIVTIMTGQRLALDTPSEAVCRQHLEEIRAGRFTEIILTKPANLHLPITAGVACVTEDQVVIGQGERAL